jgi:hypothetical protein
MARQIGNPNSPSPIYGLPAGFSIADLDSRLGQSTVVFLSAVTTGTTSAVIAMGAHGIVVGCNCPTAPTQTFDVSVYTSSGGDILIKTVVGAVHGQQIYLSNTDGVNLGGLPIKVILANLSGSAPVTITGKAIS